MRVCSTRSVSVFSPLDLDLLRPTPSCTMPSVGYIMLGLSSIMTCVNDSPPSLKGSSGFTCTRWLLARCSASSQVQYPAKGFQFKSALFLATDSMSLPWNIEICTASPLTPPVRDIAQCSPLLQVPPALRGFPVHMAPGAGHLILQPRPAAEPPLSLGPNQNCQSCESPLKNGMKQLSQVQYILLPLPEGLPKIYAHFIVVKRCRCINWSFALERMFSIVRNTGA